MAQVNSPETLLGLFKEVYDKLVIQAAPTWTIVQDRFEFEQGQAIGESYVLSVALSKEGGFVYAPTMGANSVPSSPTPIAAEILPAKIQSYGIYLASQLAYSAASRAASQGKQAFKSSYAAVLQNMRESHMFRLECSLLYGRDGLGVVEENEGGGVLELSESEFAPGIWGAGLKNNVLEAFDGTGSSANQHDGNLVISSVNIKDRKITVTGTSSAVAPDDVLYFKSSRTTTAHNECAGLFRILTNTGSLFELNASQYDSWKSQEFEVDGQLSMTAIMEAAALGQSYGLEDAILLVNPDQFADLASNEAALRRYMDSGDRGKRGPKSLEFSVGQSTVEIVSHPMIKQGHSMLLPKDEVHRIGSTDVTDQLGGSGEKFTVNVGNAMAIEFRTMSDQAIYIEVPARAVLLTGISN